MIWGGLALLALALAGAASAAAPSHVPFVGCASDGQVGPQRAPRQGAAPRVPRAAAARLAYYATGDLGVLAPRGWRCFGLEGSNGSTLIVTPDRHGFRDLQDNAGLSGPAVQLSLSIGGTSGRFEVARLIARLFPAHMDFARQVAAEGMGDPLPAGPYPTDRLRRISATQVAFTTPALQHGLGTDSRLAADGDPIEGLVILHPEGDLDAVKLDVRLPRALATLAPTIIEAVRRER